MMRISSLQLFWILIANELGLSILLTLSSTIAIVNQDVWISLLISGLATLVTAFLCVQTALLFPDKNFIELADEVLGKWLGRFFLIPYLIQWLTLTSIILREASDFIETIFFRNTPLIVVAIFLICAMVYIIYRGGIEAIGRFSEIVGPVIVISILLVIVLIIKDMTFSRIMPIGSDSSPLSLIRGSIHPLSFLGEVDMILLLIYFVKDKENVMKRSILAVIWCTLILIIASISVIMTFGPLLSAKMWYPFFEVVRFISLLDFIQNTELLIVVIWVLSVFVKLSTYLFAGSYGLSAFLGIKKWKYSILPIILVCLYISLQFKNIDATAVDFSKHFFVPYIVPYNFFFGPFLLWLVAAIKKKETV